MTVLILSFCIGRYKKYLHPRVARHIYTDEYKTQKEKDAMKKRLEGKAALVTGGSRGIGAAIALRLAEEGALVALSYSASPDKAQAVVKAIEAAGGRGEALRADQSDPAQVAQLVKTAAAKLGRLDILVNNAGVLAGGAVQESQGREAEFARQLAINVVGVAEAVRTASTLLADGGRIISIGSTIAERVPMAGMADYAATKAALVTYTKGWARDLGPRGITVNVVQPGPIATDMNPKEGDFAPVLTSLTALNRFGTSEEVAAAVAFLASDEAAYITGSALNVDGGFAA
jgi:3-oxoacyl-[acyl-carrier protein] reductase